MTLNAVTQHGPDTDLLDAVGLLVYVGMLPDGNSEMSAGNRPRKRPRINEESSPKAHNSDPPISSSSSQKFVQVSQSNSNIIMLGY